MHENGIQEFLIWLEFIKEIEYTLCKDFKSHIDLMWWHLKRYFFKFFFLFIFQVFLIEKENKKKSEI